MKYVWDKEKAKTNEKKHQVTFEEASSVFEDKDLAIGYDEKHSQTEDRFKAIGLSKRKRCLVVIFCEYSEEEEEIRIISARCAEKFEEKIYFRQKTGGGKVLLNLIKKNSFY